MAKKILIVIPARGGSRGIPNKNLKLMHGKPLLSYSINCALNSKYNPTVVVTSEDERIRSIAKRYGASTIDRPAELSGDRVTLDPVIFHAVNMMDHDHSLFDYVITMQPTTPTLTTNTLDKALDVFFENDYDTLIAGFNDPRLSWRKVDGEYIPNYEKRVNRQFLPEEIKETGAFVITKRQFISKNSRFGKKLSIFVMPEEEVCDIDNPDDWIIAEKKLGRKRILIRVDGYREIGMGHIYRCLQIADAFVEHNLLFVLSKKSDLGISMLEKSKYDYSIIDNPDEIYGIIETYKPNIIINDILNTSKEYVMQLQSNARVVNFEDLGEGALIADATINDLYEKCEDTWPRNVYWGPDYYIMRDEFQLARTYCFNENVNEILVVFGGTDPCNLTTKTLDALSAIDAHIHITIVAGLGYKEIDELIKQKDQLKLNADIYQDVALISEYMEKADIAISSQGRTMLELSSIGVPTILMAQNSREKRHSYGYMHNGFINLGLGSEIKTATLSNTISWLIDCPQIRKNMHEELLSTDLKHGMERVKTIILGEWRS